MWCVRNEHGEQFRRMFSTVKSKYSKEIVEDLKESALEFDWEEDAKKAIDALEEDMKNWELGIPSQVLNPAKTKFAHKQTLRTESSRKISAIAKEKITAGAKQREIGDVGMYKELTRGAPKGGFQDGLEAHHMPSRAFIEKYGIPESEGLAVMMTKELHKETRTYGRKPSASNTPRGELARDILDV
jgi:hypothetical protein